VVGAGESLRSPVPRGRAAPTPLEDSAAVRRAATSILAAAAAALALAACGDDAGHREFGTFTDCSTVGRPVVTNDPKGDQRRTNGTPDDSAPQGDLVRLRLARSGDRLCAEFQAPAAVKPYVAYVLTMRPQDRDTPVVQLEATVLAGQRPEALLDGTGTGKSFRKIPATVGIKGDRLSILVRSGPFADQNAAAIFRSFRFQARSAVAVEDHGRVTDCLPVCQ
jgi:hypothetical protein